MAGKFSSFFLEHGFKVMMVGFAISVIGLLVYMKFRYEGNLIPQIAFGTTIFGFAIYVFGRVFVAISRRQAKKRTETQKSEQG
jgi:hypothetical protein